MAKAKSKVTRKTKARPIKALPRGYKVIGRAPNWDIEKNPVIEGVRGTAREVTFDEGTKNERTVRTMIVEDETLGAVNVWESGFLRDLFDRSEDGDTVRIEYLGMGKAKKGENAPRLFQCSVKE